MEGTIDGKASERIRLHAIRRARKRYNEWHAIGRACKSILRAPKAETFVTLSGIRTNIPRTGVVIKDGSKVITK